MKGELMNINNGELNANGFIVRRINKSRGKTYLGVENDNWPLNNIYYDDSQNHEINYLMNYYDDNIDISWQGDCVEVCCNIDYIRRYFNACNELNIEVDIIYCETNLIHPNFNNIQCIEQLKDNFIGYDYAYSGGSYYSCVLNDVVSMRLLEFSKVKLNKFGLFDTINDLMEFIKKRNQLKDISPQFTFENGDFIIYKLYNVSNLSSKFF
jgi:hypothetical protein